MNAGIADADQPRLAARGAPRTAGPTDGILDAYEAERLPITEQVSHFAMDHAHADDRSARRAVPADIEAPAPAGDAVRAELGREAYELNVQQYCCGGLNFGYFYDGSPIIAYDGEPAPAYTMGDFTPSTVPGCRTPHLWLRDGRSLYDALGPDYTLLRFDRGSTSRRWQRAAARRATCRSTVLDVDAGDVPRAYRHRLVLCRADQHVAWRGDRVPARADELVAQLRGQARETAAAR